MPGTCVRSTLQIWIVPAVTGVEPRYQQEHFSPELKRGAMRLIISSDGADGSLAVRQDVRIYAGLFDGAERATLQLPADRYAYVHVARGNIHVNGIALGEDDGARLRDE